MFLFIITDIIYDIDVSKTPHKGGFIAMVKKLIYENRLSCEEDVKDFVMEGNTSVYFEN